LDSLHNATMYKTRQRLAVSASRGVRSHGGNSAVVLSVSGHPDVSVLSPAGSPRVLDQPVISSSIDSVSSSEDSVIELSGRASGLIVDSSAVELEGRLRGINGNRDGLHGNGLSKSGLRSRGNISEGSDGRSAVGSRVLALVGSRGGVGIRSFSIDSLVGNDVLEGVVHETSVASVVSLGNRAIDEVLLREGDESSGGEEVASFNGSSSGE